MQTAEGRAASSPVLRCRHCTQCFPPDHRAIGYWSDNLMVSMPQTCPGCHARAVYGLFDLVRDPS